MIMLPVKSGTFHGISNRQVFMEEFLEWNTKISNPTRFKHTVKLGHRFSIVRNMFKHMNTEYIVKHTAREGDILYVNFVCCFLGIYIYIKILCSGFEKNFFQDGLRCKMQHSFRIQKRIKRRDMDINMAMSFKASANWTFCLSRFDTKWKKA